MNQFNNREIASAIWLLAFLGFALSKPDIRSSVAELLRAFFRVKIVVPICLMAIYTTVVVMSLSAISLWNTGLLKDTIIWFCFVGIAIAFNAITSTRAENVFHKILIDSLKITVILEFLVSTYTFSLGVELLVIPMVTVIAMIDAFAGTDPKYAVVAKLTGSLQFLIGVVIVTFAVSGAVHDFGNLKSLDPIRSILLAPLLSVLLSPLVYLMVLESEYEEAFCRLGFSARMDSAVHRYARRRIRMYAGLNLSKLRRISRDHVVDLLDLKTRDDVDSLLQAGKDH